MPLKIVTRKLSELTPDPDNARRHGTRNLELITDSLTIHGQTRPILVTTDDGIIAGNGTYAAASALGWDTIDCVVFTGSPERAAAYALADNRTADAAEWETWLAEHHDEPACPSRSPRTRRAARSRPGSGSARRPRRAR